jgi:hypothetical protein
MISRVIALMASIAMTSLAHSADALTPQSIGGRFFEIFLKGGNVEAIDYFMELNPLLKANAEQRQQMKDLLTRAVRLYGPPIAVELVSVEDITPSLQRRVYLTKHANHPLVWEMYFYRAKDEWMPDQVLFVDQYQILGRKT